MKFILLFFLGSLLFASEDIMDVEYPNYYKPFSTINHKLDINKTIKTKNEINSSNIHKVSIKIKHKSIKKFIIYFGFDSYKVDKKYYPLIKKLSKYSNITIKGYSDDYGNPIYNKYLSQKRADEIKKLFLKYKAKDIKAIGMGATNKKGKKYRKAIIFVKD